MPIKVRLDGDSFWKFLASLDIPVNSRHWTNPLQYAREARFINITSSKRMFAVLACLGGAGEDRTQHSLTTTAGLYSTWWAPNAVHYQQFKNGREYCDGVCRWRPVCLRGLSPADDCRLVGLS